MGAMESDSLETTLSQIDGLRNLSTTLPFLSPLESKNVQVYMSPKAVAFCQINQE